MFSKLVSVYDKLFESLDILSDVFSVGHFHIVVDIFFLFNIMPINSMIKNSHFCQNSGHFICSLRPEEDLEFRTV